MVSGTRTRFEPGHAIYSYRCAQCLPARGYMKLLTEFPTLAPVFATYFPRPRLDLHSAQHFIDSVCVGAEKVFYRVGQLVGRMYRFSSDNVLSTHKT
jgi:hypothetical protein